ncbi:MAG: DegT/DnrJ/EryC1/StrS family aminotransferase [Nanoarchaeota archaeon]|nr:DegT/DnrJ/EryC1/StrS family aminotransferase [Nanoarchaeota archaeon]
MGSLADEPNTLYFGELRFSERAKANIKEVLKRNYVIAAGPEVEAYQREWGHIFGYKHNVALSSGTSADIVACKTLFDVHPKARRSLNLADNEIIVPALSFVASGQSILEAGFKPVFVDVERETLTINPRKIEEAITDKTRGIMAVHLMGKPCEMDTIMDIANRHDLYVIEDACEAHGATYKGKFIGKWGHMAAFSSYIAHLICSVEGGMLSTDDGRIAEVAASIRNHGRKHGSMYFDHERLGGNYKMHDLEAAVGRAAIENFWETFNVRKQNIYWMMEATKDLQGVAHMNIEGPNEVICPHAYTITLKDPAQYDIAQLYTFMNNNPVLNIKAKRNFGAMPTQHRAFEFMGHKVGEFPEAEYVGTYGIHFGLHQYTTPEQLEKASEVLHKFFAENKK